MIMSIFKWLWILIFTIRVSKQECGLGELRGSQFSYRCSNTDPDTFLYDFFDNISVCGNYGYSLEITNSNFISVHSFFSPYENECYLAEFSLTNSSVEFIEDWAFENFIVLHTLNLSNNKLHNITFVSTLPRNLEILILNHNKFEALYNVFSGLVRLKILDLSDCKISFIDSNSFSSLFAEIFIGLRNNKLTSFDVVFKDGLNLDIDLSFNNVKYINNDNYRRVHFRGINASHNKIKMISDLSCQDCGYDYYRNVIQYVDLSFNNLNHMKLLHSFSGLKLEVLNLSSSNIDSTFDFEILRSVTTTLDLSNNKLETLTPKTFGTNVRISHLILSNSSIKSINEQTFANSQIQVLNIDSNFITELKDFTFINSVIKILDLSNCLIHTIHSNAFSNLVVSETLDLSNNRLTRILRNTFQHLMLAKLDLSFNFIKKLDDNLFLNCESLGILNLSNSQIEVIQSKAFSGIKGMSQLHLQNNLITKINFQTANVYKILNLKNNTFLNLDLSFLLNSSASVILLSDNNIGALSNNSISAITLFEKIDLSNSKICTINANAFWRITNVKVLDLKNNCLDKILPRTFFALKKLVRLDLSGNKLRTFSKDAFAFGNSLKELGISFFDTNLSTNTFLTLNNLKTLNISHSRITVLEDNCFRGLIHLENFNLHGVEIKEITPGAFKGLNNLRRANFRMFFKNINIIKGYSFVGLPKLETLNISNLQISSLEPKAFIGLANLESLFLNNNKIEKISSNTFSGLMSLKFLNLSSNHIVELDPQAFSGLVSLNGLSLSHNNLTKLVLGTFQEFPKLRLLDLHRNNINKILTGTFSNLKFLTELDLSYNNITKIKMENLMPLTALTRLELTGNHLIQMSHLDLIKSLTHLKFVGINDNKWKCDNLATMLIAFQKYSIDWVSTNAMTLTHENIDGIKCYDICKFFYCVEEEETLYSSKKI